MARGKISSLILGKILDLKKSQYWAVRLTICLIKGHRSLWVLVWIWGLTAFIKEICGFSSWIPTPVLAYSLKWSETGQKYYAYSGVFLAILELMSILRMTDLHVQGQSVPRLSELVVISSLCGRKATSLGFCSRQQILCLKACGNGESFLQLWACVAQVISLG